jgi:hypothetical protein
MYLYLPVSYNNLELILAKIVTVNYVNLVYKSDLVPLPIKYRASV